MSLVFSVPSNSLTARSSCTFQSTESTRQRIDDILANRKRLGSDASVYTHPIQGSPRACGFHLRPPTAAPGSDVNDGNWIARSATPLSLSPRQNDPLAAPLENLRNWCALTHSPWKDAEGRVLPYNSVEEAHVVSRSLKPHDKARLEVAWGFKPGEFDFDGPLNTIPLRANWHTSFDKSEWVLLPPLDILDSILQATSETLVSTGARAAADEGCRLVTEDGNLIYKVYQYKIVPFGTPTELIRMDFKNGKQYIELEEEAHTRYKPGNYRRWPTVASTVHPFTVIWKAVTVFGVNTPLEDLHVRADASRMLMARQIYQLWMAYADANHRPFSPELSDRDASSPSNHGSRRSGKSSKRKRQRTHSDVGSVSSRPTRASAPNKRARKAPGDVDRVPSLVFNSEDCGTLSSYHLESPSLIDRPVRVAPEDQEDSDDDDDEHRPSALQPQRKFNIADWAKTASGQAKPVIETECVFDPNVSEEPRKPPRGSWKRWPPAYKLSGCFGSRLS